MVPYSFNVRLTPGEALSRIIDQTEGELIHQELNELGSGRFIGTLVYERYFFRTGNQAALIIIADNIRESHLTNIRLIAAGSSNSLIFKIDFGAGERFASSIEEALAPFREEAAEE